jgi:hypothetical protein
VGLILSFSTPYLKTVVKIISVAHRRLSHATNILLIAHKTAAGGTEEDFKQNWNKTGMCQLILLKFSISYKSMF